MKCRVMPWHDPAGNDILTTKNSDLPVTSLQIPSKKRRLPNWDSLLHISLPFYLLEKTPGNCKTGKNNCNHRHQFDEDV
jgi:hypothetical protein